MAQTPAYTIYTIQEGLAQMKVSTVFLDKRGLLWIGTRNGLSRFDGEHFVSYSISEGLLNDRVLALDHGPEDDILILTAGGIQLYNGAEFTSYPHAFPNVQYDAKCLPDSSIWILDRRDNTVWNLHQGQYHVAHQFVDHASDAKLIYDPIAEELSVAGLDGLVVLWPDANRDTMDFSLKSFLQLMGDVRKQSVFSQSAPSPRFYTYQNRTAMPVAIYEQEVLRDLVPNGLWVYHQNTLHLPAIFGQRKTIRDVFINVEDVIVDSASQFWIASDVGLGRVYPDLFKHIPYKDLPTVWSIVEDDRGMWFGAYGNGLYHLPHGEEQPIRIETSGSAGLREYLLGAVKTPDGSLHFAHTLGVITVPAHALTPEYKRKYPVFTLQYDTVRNVFLEGVYKGIHVLSYDGQLMKFWGPEEGVHSNDYIQHIAIDHEDCYWLCSYTGISRVCPEENQVTAFTQEDGSLPVRSVFAACQDTDGRLWLGCDQGLLFYDFDETGMHLVQSAVLQEMVKSLLVLDSSYLLIAAKTGLYTLNFRAFRESGILDLQTFNKSTGYLGIEPGFNSLYKDASGRVWIASASGTDILSPERINHSHQGLSVLITHIDETSIPFNHDLHTFPLVQKKNSVTIHYTAIGMHRSHQTRYQYRLNNESWSEWSPTPSTLLTDLRHGKHTFSVRAGPVDTNPEEGVSDAIVFEVSLAIYQRPFFLPAVILMLCLLLGIALILVFRQRRARRLFMAQQKESRYLRSQLLLAELNPHFIFNVLASIQNKILTGRKEEASAYIVKLSRLMRNFLQATYRSNEQSGHEYEISLSAEVELLSAYVQFEQDKSDGHFDFQIETDPGLHPDQVTLPPMLVQPYVENAIKHGLLPRTPGGLLEVLFQATSSGLQCIVRDNGIGRTEAKRRAETGFQTHRSLGTQIIGERIALLNQLGYQITVFTHDLLPSGTEVKIRIAESTSG